MSNLNNKAPHPEYIRSYKNLYGMDMSGRDKNSFLYLENMYVDYDGGGGYVESIPGYRKIVSLDRPLNSIALCGRGDNKFLLIHSGDELFMLGTNERERVKSLSPIAKITDSKSRIFSFGSLVLITDGTKLYRVSEGGIEEISSDSRITGCTVTAVFDGRIFLSGNRDFPSMIYYSDPVTDESVTFSELGSLSSSIGKAGVVSLLPFGDKLWVFKSTDEGDGSIALIKPGGEGYSIDKHIHAPACLSGAMAFDGRIVYMSVDGVMYIDEPMKDDTLKVICTSLPIAPLIKQESISDAQLSIWLGYGVIAFGERVYLADIRQTPGEYKWYFLNSIGGYKGDRQVFRYSIDSREGYKTHPDKNKVAKGEIISQMMENGETVYYSLEGDERYLVYPTSERYGGELMPAVKYVTDGCLLWFATEQSDIYLFNNDRRGLTPCGREITDSVSPLRRKIHSDYYSFDNHKTTYCAITHTDDCEHPTKEKCASPDSLSLELKSYDRSHVTLSVITDGRIRSKFEISPTLRNLSTSDEPSDGAFMNEEYLANLSERASAWRKRQLKFTNNEFCSPFGIKSISFGYRLK